MVGARRLRRASAVLILAAYPRRPAAERVAKLLVRERVLACATIVPGGRAFYSWRGRRQAEPSTLLFGKTTRARADEAVRRLRETHPDQVPEILVFHVAGGNPDYLAWVAEEVKRR
jgi:periplasmic divalent cation tolerance protein